MGTVGLGSFVTDALVYRLGDYMLFVLPSLLTGSTAALLTGRELLVLQLLARGYSPRQVALLTSTDARAVSDALAGAVRALRASDVAEAVAVARERGLIT